MKAKLEFDLNDFDNDDRSSFEDAINGTKWRLAMWELDQWLRSQYKYMSDEDYKEQCRFYLVPCNPHDDPTNRNNRQLSHFLNLVVLFF